MAEFRPDRLATLYFFHPLRRLLRMGPAGIPILMYHSISDKHEGHRNAYFRTCTPPELFSRQMEFLAENGYQVIGLSQAVRELTSETRDLGKFLVLTFDDGFRDFYTQAFPRLSHFGYTATVYLPTNYVGDDARIFNGKECLTWGEVKELRRSGVEFGSHTASHPQLKTLPMAQVSEELRTSKHEIENRLGEKIVSFSYPYAFPETDRRLRQHLWGVLQECGYQNGVSTIIGTAHFGSDQFFLERLPVNSGDDVAFFGSKLRGGYDWLHPIQAARKCLRMDHAA